MLRALNLKAEQRTAEPQNNEPQNVEVWFRFAQSFFNGQNSFLRHSMFTVRLRRIRNSLFDIRFYIEPLNPF